MSRAGEGCWREDRPRITYAPLQHDIDGSVPDIVDRFDNLYEVKYRNYPDWMTDDLVRSDFQKILDQAWIQQREAAALGTSFTLAFELPLSPRHQEIFDDMFATLRARNNVAIILGF